MVVSDATVTRPAVPAVTPEEFRDALRAGIERWGHAEWLPDRIDGDAVIVLFRRDDVRGTEVRPGPIEGTRLVFSAFPAMILGPGTHALDEILGEAILEIVEPGQPGVPLEVPWADGLYDNPQHVLWRPDAVLAAAELR